MVENDFENVRISNFQGLLTLTLDQVIWKTLCISHQPYLHAKFHLNRKTSFRAVHATREGEGPWRAHGVRA